MKCPKCNGTLAHGIASGEAWMCWECGNDSTKDAEAKAAAKERAAFRRKIRDRYHAGAIGWLGYKDLLAYLKQRGKKK